MLVCISGHVTQWRYGGFWALLRFVGWRREVNDNLIIICLNSFILQALGVPKVCYAAAVCQCPGATAPNIQIKENPEMSKSYGTQHATPPPLKSTNKTKVR